MSESTATYHKFANLVGNTPLLDLTDMMTPNVHGMSVRVLGKAEFMNPSFSNKDRTMKAIIDKAEKAG